MPPGSSTDMGLKAVVAPETDRRKAERAATEMQRIFEDALGGISDMLTPDPTAIRQGAGRMVGGVVSSTVPTRVGTKAGRGLGRVIGGPGTFGGGGGGGSSGPGTGGDGVSGALDEGVQVAQLDKLEEIHDELQKIGVSMSGSGGGGGGGFLSGLGLGMGGGSILGKLGGMLGGAVGFGKRMLSKGKGIVPGGGLPGVGVPSGPMLPIGPWIGKMIKDRINDIREWLGNDPIGVGGRGGDPGQMSISGGMAMGAPIGLLKDLNEGGIGFNMPKGLGDGIGVNLPEGIQSGGFGVNLPESLQGGSFGISVPEFLQDDSIGLSVPESLSGGSLGVSVPDALQGGNIGVSVPQALKDFTDAVDGGIDFNLPDWMSGQGSDPFNINFEHDFSIELPIEGMKPSDVENLVERHIESALEDFRREIEQDLSGNWFQGGP